jgi:hypothetical protein
MPRKPRVIKAGLAALLASVALAAVPAAAASASSSVAGVNSRKVTCGPPQSPASGTAHAKIRDCSITWYEDTVNDVEHASVSFQLLDSASDGVCADATVASSAVTKSYSECNGVWQTETLAIPVWVPSAKITLSYGGHSPVSETVTDPYPHL